MERVTWRNAVAAFNTLLWVKYFIRICKPFARIKRLLCMRYFITSIAVFTMLYLLTACSKKSSVMIQPAPLPFSDSFKNYLALGDSYTIGQSVTEAERFPQQTIQLLKQNSLSFNSAEYIAVTGWTTGNLLHRLNSNPPSKNTYDIVTLLIGVNNQYQGRSQVEYANEFTSLLNLAIGYAGNRPQRVVVLSIPDWGVTPFASGMDRALIARQIDSFNSINRQIAAVKTVQYIDITASTRMAATDGSLIASDGLHPSGLEYNKWAVLLAQVIKAVL